MTAKQQIKGLRDKCSDVANKLEDKLDALREVEECYKEGAVFAGHSKNGAPIMRPIDDVVVAFLYEEVFASLSDILKETRKALRSFNSERNLLEQE